MDIILLFGADWSNYLRVLYKCVQTVIFQT